MTEKLANPNVEKLKALQVKAELSKLPDAPRAYFEKLALENKMNDEETMLATTQKEAGSISITERFRNL
jgi:hypothetical protein